MVNEDGSLRGGAGNMFIPVQHLTLALQPVLANETVHDAGFVLQTRACNVFGDCSSFIDSEVLRVAPADAGVADVAMQCNARRQQCQVGSSCPCPRSRHSLL